jgi:hypothetical protein
MSFEINIKYLSNIHAPHQECINKLISEDTDERREYTIMLDKLINEEFFFHSTKLFVPGRKAKRFQDHI